MIKPTVFLEYKNKLYYDEKNILCLVNLMFRSHLLMSNNERQCDRCVE